MRVILVCLVLFCLSLIVESARTRKAKQRADRPRKSSQIVKERRRKERAKTTVISCRVFKRGTCKQTRQNTISSSPSVKSKSRCQQLCFATQGCAGFTFHEGGKRERRRCALFKDCRGERGRCDNCISGPIMPRINECLAGRQQLPPPGVEYAVSCPAGCAAVCVGPQCEDLLTDITEEPTSDMLDDTTTNNDYTNNNPLSDSELYEVDYVDEDKLDEVTESSDDYYDYSSYDNDIDTEDYDYDYNYDDNNEADKPGDFPLEDDAIEEEEEEEEEDINIDEGFLNDANNEPVELPDLNKRSNVVEPSRNGSLVLFFVLIGGIDANGTPINMIDLLNTGLGNSALGLSLAPLPLAVTQGGECSAAYTEGSITSCGRGVRSLSPYGYQDRPGSCYGYGLKSQRWEARGGKMTSFRKGASVTKLGRYLVASGGYKQKRSLNTIEVLDPAKPRAGWRRLAALKIPGGVSEHCTVAMSGRNGKEVVITGGRGRKSRAMKLNIRTKRWYMLNDMNTGRQNHACVKASLNGHHGMIVSGGSSTGNASLASVEFYNAKTGTWLRMPSMRKGRSGHTMTITRGKLLVAGGERKGRSGRQILDDVEIFTGKRWVKSKQKLERPRSRFSLVKIPKQKIVKQKKKNLKG